jgi:hypothetical protein
MRNLSRILELLEDETKENDLTDQGYKDYLDIVYSIYTDSSMEEVYNSFSTPQDIRDGSTKPLAWYATNYDIPGVYPESPIQELTGFIPNRINTIIFSDESVEYKMNTLNLLFGDLPTI